jgi:hypothetical protein
MNRDCRSENMGKEERLSSDYKKAYKEFDKELTNCVLFISSAIDELKENKTIRCALMLNDMHNRLVEFRQKSCVYDFKF